MPQQPPRRPGWHSDRTAHARLRGTDGVRLFGLPIHPQPKDGRTYRIKNKDGQPLPTTFTGVPASGFLIGKAEQAKRRGRWWECALVPQHRLG